MHNCGGQPTEQLLMQRDGRIAVVLICTCGVKIKTVRSPRGDDHRLPEYKDNRCGCGGVGCARCHSNPCARCGSYELVEYHHWAPQALFDDADDWPGSTLCRRCHLIWHQRVTPHLRRAHDRQTGIEPNGIWPPAA